MHTDHPTAGMVTWVAGARFSFGVPGAPGGAGKKRTGFGDGIYAMAGGRITKIGYVESSTNVSADPIVAGQSRKQTLCRAGQGDWLGSTDQSDWVERPMANE